MSEAGAFITAAAGWPAALKLRDAARAEILVACGEPDLAAA